MPNIEQTNGIEYENLVTLGNGVTYTTASGTNYINLNNLEDETFLDELRERYNFDTPIRHTFSSVDRYNQTSNTKKKKVSKAKREVLLSSINNRNYLCKLDEQQKDCRKFFSIAINNLMKFEEADMKIFASTLGTRLNSYDDEYKHKIINLFNTFVRIFEVKQNPVEYFDRYYQHTLEDLKNTDMGKINFKLIVDNKLEDKFLRFLNIVRGYLIKTKDYDRDCKSIRNVTSF